MTKVQFILAGVTTEVDYVPGDTLLDTALRNHLNAPYSCMEGICSTCICHIDKGQVDDKSETVLSCQTKPLPECELVVVNYDKV